MTRAFDVVVLGGGIFGITGALTLRERGHSVVLIDPGPLPHPLAASTDLSKFVRLDYGADTFYAEVMERALVKWRADPLFHETGILFITRTPMEKGMFERESFDLLTARGHALERLDADELVRRFPEWAPSAYVDGYYNPEGGWAESGRVVAAYVERARRAGVEIREQRLSLDSPEVNRAGCVVVAAGAWTPKLLPELAPALRSVGQPVFHFLPENPGKFMPPGFVPWSADVSRTGWYGFAMHPSGVVKIANHGPGTVIDPDADRTLPIDTEARFREFLRASIPGLAGAKVASTRMCLYTDSADGDLWITRHPQRANVVVASGGSGHGFKFAPLLGDWIADAVEGHTNETSARFGWRTISAARFEPARYGASGE
jgi:glycine/D-amino acid oxidase-like deaminating enzyme